MTKKKIEKNQWWRPTLFDEETVEKLIEAFKKDATVEEACSYAGIHRDTFYKRLKKDKKFFDKIEDAKQYPFIKCKTKIFNAIENKDPNISAKYALEFLKRRHPDWKDKQENTVDYAFTSITIEDATWEESMNKTDTEAEGALEEISG